MIHYKALLTGLLALPVCFLYAKLYRKYMEVKKEYKELLLFNKRHNCIVMYASGELRGWPPYSDLKITTENLHLIVEPHLFFIKSAKFKLDVAMMCIGVKSIFEALEEAAARGVEIRIIVDFLSVASMNAQFRKLMKSGIKVTFFVNKTGKQNNIMHLKYIVKDYNNHSGYLTFGSLNLTSLSSILKNYEDVVFTSELNLVEQFARNFENCWLMITEDNRKMYNNTVLTEAGFVC